jgi:hypothetical protein
MNKPDDNNVEAEKTNTAKLLNKVGWDLKVIPIEDEEAERKARIQAYLDSEITVDYIKSHQQEEEQIDVMSNIFGYMEDLMWANRFDIIDEYIMEFCNCDRPVICFQYFVCLLTAAMWAKDRLDNREYLKAKTIEAGKRELHDRDKVLRILHGLL